MKFVGVDCRKFGDKETEVSYGFNPYYGVVDSIEVKSKTQSRADEIRKQVLEAVFPPPQLPSEKSNGGDDYIT